MIAEQKRGRLISLAVLVLVVAFAGFQAFCRNQPETTEAASEKPVSTSPAEVSGKAGNPSRDTQQKSQTVVYYFHTTRRCGPCSYIENLTKKVVLEDYAQHIKRGDLAFKAVNVEHSQNRHLIQRYNLFSQAVVVSHVVDGDEKEWKNLDRIWSLLRNQNQFEQYIKDEINKYLKG